MLQPIRIRLTTLSCFETNIYLGVVLRTHASKPVSDPQTKIICKQTLLISQFILYTGGPSSLHERARDFCLQAVLCYKRLFTKVCMGCKRFFLKERKNDFFK